MKRNICLLAVLLICAFSNAKVQPSALIADNMVATTGRGSALGESRA